MCKMYSGSYCWNTRGHSAKIKKGSRKTNGLLLTVNSLGNLKLFEGIFEHFAFCRFFVRGNVREATVSLLVHCSKFF